MTASVKPLVEEQKGFDQAIRDRLDRLVNLHLSHGAAPYSVQFNGLGLTMLPGVFCPAYGEGSQLLARCLSRLEGHSVWDLGTGSGALALVAARAGAGKVVGTDIAPVAVECARTNAHRLGLESRVEFRLGDLFDPLARNEVFDLIAFNLPFMRSPDHYGMHICDLHVKSLVDAIFDDSNLLERFLGGAARCLSLEGRILLAYSNVGDMELFGNAVRAAGYESQMLTESGTTLRFYAFELRKEPSTW